MLLSSIPVKFPIPFGASAGGSYIRQVPTASQVGISAGAASLTDGFPPVTFLPTAGGGTPPWGQDFNGILNQITAWSQWYQAGAPIVYDATFATAIGGYPKNTVLMSAIVPGNYWMATIDSNASDPDAGGAGWVPAPGHPTTGDYTFSLTSSARNGWVPGLSGNTIGNAVSGATYAGPQTQFLFSFFWNFSNTVCPVSGGRGANAAADFAAGKRIGVYDFSGSSVVVVDNGTGRLTGVPVTLGNNNLPGSIIGENLHTLTTAEIPLHTHGYSATSSLENAAHTHNGAATSTGMSANNPHSHPYTGLSATNDMQGGGASVFRTPVGTNTNLTDINHSHDVAFTTTAQSANHTHTVTGTTDTGSVAGGSHNTVSRSVVVFPFFKL